MLYKASVLANTQYSSYRYPVLQNNCTYVWLITYSNLKGMNSPCFITSYVCCINELFNKTDHCTHCLVNVYRSTFMHDYQFSEQLDKGLKANVLLFHYLLSTYIDLSIFKWNLACSKWCIEYHNAVYNNHKNEQYKYWRKANK